MKKPDRSGLCIAVEAIWPLLLVPVSTFDAQLKAFLGAQKQQMHRLVFSITQRQMKEGRRTYLFNVRVKAFLIKGSLQ